MHIYRVGSSFYGRVTIGNDRHYARGDTLQECQDKLFKIIGG